MGQKEVPGLDVSVNQLGFVPSVFKRLGHSEAKGQRLGGGEEALTPEPVAQGFALDQFHGDVTPAVAFIGRIDLDDVGMVELSCGNGFAVKTRGVFGIGGEIGRQEFERDSALERQIAGHIHSAEPAFADASDDLVAGESLALEVRFTAILHDDRRLSVTPVESSMKSRDWVRGVMTWPSRN